MLNALARLRRSDVPHFLESLGTVEKQALIAQLFDFNRAFAREPQRYPEGDWATWLLMAGRGFGKTRVGSETVHGWANEHPGCRIALIARTAGDVRDVVVEGESGILETAPPWNRPHYEPSKRRLTWPNGTRATTFSAEKPDLLRGPQFHFAWADELASWKHLAGTWTNLQMGLRLPGIRPRCVVTTTPRPLRFLRELREDPTTRLSSGSTYENRRNLAPAFLEQLERLYGGTTVGRQELFAELLDSAEGALWNRTIIDPYRVKETPDLDRILIGVDPAVSDNEQTDECGIVAAGSALIDTGGRKPVRHYYVLDDRTDVLSPMKWAQTIAALYGEQEADGIIAEANNGGELVRLNIRSVNSELPVKIVHASRGKVARAEPIASLYEQGRVHHLGNLTHLEDQLCNWVPNQGLRSPGRLDATVWVLHELSKQTEDDVTTLGPAASADRKSPWKA